MPKPIHLYRRDIAHHSHVLGKMHDLGRGPRHLEPSDGLPRSSYAVDLCQMEYDASTSHESWPGSTFWSSWIPFLNLAPSTGVKTLEHMHPKLKATLVFTAQLSVHQCDDLVFAISQHPKRLNPTVIGPVLVCLVRIEASRGFLVSGQTGMIIGHV